MGKQTIQQSRSVFIATIIALLSLQADRLFYIIHQVITLTQKKATLTRQIYYILLTVNPPEGVRVSIQLEKKKKLNGASLYKIEKKKCAVHV